LKEKFIGWGARRLLILGVFSLGLAAWAEISERTEDRSEHKEGFVAVEYAFGLGLGIRDFLVETAKCLGQLLRHPILSAQEMVRSIVHFDETYRTVKNLILATIEAYPSMTYAEKGRLHARLATESLYIFGFITIPQTNFVKLKSATEFMEKAGQSLKKSTAALSQRAINALPKSLLNPATSMSMKIQPLGIAEWFASEGQ